MILEVCTGLPAYDESKRVGDRQLTDFVDSHVDSGEKAHELADKSCRWVWATYDALFKLGRLCVSERPKCRPTMSVVRVVYNHSVSRAVYRHIDYINTLRVGVHINNVYNH